MINKYLKYSFCTLILLIISCNINAQNKTKKDTTNVILSEEDIIQHLANRNDSTTWNIKMFKGDLKSLDNNKTGPFTYGAFPVPEYNLIGKGTFGGLGYYTHTGHPDAILRIEDKTLVSTSFYEGESVLNKGNINEDGTSVFFQIIVLTDFIDDVNYSHRESLILSRNHPDYMGQGYYKTKNNQIDYAAFVTHDKHSYAIINTRLFDLKYGKTILIAPQKDRSLRSMQIKSPELSDKQIQEYFDRLLKEKEVVDFFTAAGNI